MGMFDYVNYKMKCPTCGAEMADFQTKDLGCTMAVVEITEVLNFYDSCRKCGT